MKSAPELAADPELAAAFEAHRHETEEHERAVTARLQAHGATPATLKDLAGAISGKGFVLFAQSQPDTPGKLVAHAYSYEHMEVAAYELLAIVAAQAGDQETVQVARGIGEQERVMAQRLEASFDRAVDASLDGRDAAARLDSYLTDAHAIEGQSIKLLEKGPDLAGTSELAAAYTEHLAESRHHQQLLENRLQARGAGPSALKDAALKLGALNWGLFFAAQPDTPAKLAGFAYAVEHLEIASYELLKRVAIRAGDSDTAQAAEQILAQERAAAERIRTNFPNAIDAALQEQGVGAP
jgi:ferritin-like metal-binding protein YciE